MASVQQSSEKTFYREEEEEVTYITYHDQKEESNAYTLKQRSNGELNKNEQLDLDNEFLQMGNRGTNYRVVRIREPLRRKSATSGGKKWKVMLALLLLAGLAAGIYYMYFM